MQLLIISLWVIGIHARIGDSKPAFTEGVTFNCSTLLPLNLSGIVSQETPTPYAVSATMSDDKIRVTISASVGEGFEAFVLQARSSKDLSQLIDGEFSSSEVSKTTDCFNGKKNTLMQVNTELKKEITTEWSPSEIVNEDVLFRATIVKHNAYWAELYSPPVTFDDYMLSDEQHSDSPSLYEQCFKSEGCVGFPEGCVQGSNCEILLKYSKSSNGIDFSLNGHIESNDYIAMAISEDAKMGDDYVTECIRNESKVIARESWNSGKANNFIKEKELYKGSLTDGLVSCMWTSSLLTVINEQNYDFENKAYYILLAKGHVENDGRLMYHKGYGRMASEELELNRFGEITDVPGSVTINDETTEHNEGEIKSTSQNEESSTEDSTSSSFSVQFSSSLIIFIILGLFYAA